VAVFEGGSIDSSIDESIPWLNVTQSVLLLEPATISKAFSRGCCKQFCTVSKRYQYDKHDESKLIDNLDVKVS
jgi:hypothetical protein